MTTIVTTATLLGAVIMIAAWVIGAHEHAAHERRAQDQARAQAAAGTRVPDPSAPAGVEELEPERARFEVDQRGRRSELKRASRRELASHTR